MLSGKHKEIMLVTLLSIIGLSKSKDRRVYLKYSGVIFTVKVIIPIIFSIMDLPNSWTSSFQIKG